jgi:hypothetical protein
MSVRALVHATVAERLPAVGMLKTHNIYGAVNGLPTINPAASAGGIYIVRDPRDVAISLSRHLGSTVDRAIEVMETPGFSTSNDPETVFEIWGTWSQHVQSWTSTPDPANLVIRYEDMMGTPTATFTAVARHLRQPATDAQIAEAIELSSFDKLKRQEEERGFRERSERAERFFATGKSGAWRGKLTPAQVAAIVDAHGPMMARHGYFG